MRVRAKRWQVWLIVVVLGLLAPHALAAGQDGPPAGPALPPSYGVVNAGRGIPANGGVLLLAPPLAQVSVVVTIVGLPDVPVDGTLSALSAEYWVWVPAEPMVAGIQYQVALTISGNPAEEPALLSSFDAIEAIEIEPPELMAEPSVSLVHWPTQQRRCRSLVGQGLLDNNISVITEELIDVLLEPGLSTAAPDKLLNQFMFDIEWGHLPGNPSMVPWSRLFLPETEAQADEYCFALEAVSITTGESFVYEDIERCVPHGDLGTIGYQAAEISDAELHRDRCRGAPLGLEEQWCEANQACASDETATNCTLYGHFCEDEPLPRVDDVPRLDAGPAPAGDAPDSGDQEPISEDLPERGCSVAAPGATGSAADASALFAMLALAARFGPRCATVRRHTLVLARALARFLNKTGL
jgi:hypothetical protein